MSKKIGKKEWVIADGFLPAKSNGDFVSHEAICVLNTGEEDATIDIVFYFEDKPPRTGFQEVCPAERTYHIRLDKIKDDEGNKLPVDVPYAAKVSSDQPIVVQHSRMDTTQKELSLMTTIAYS